MTKKRKIIYLVAGVITCIAALLSSNTAFSQDHVDEEMYQAYLSAEIKSETWKSAVATRKKEFESKPNDKNAGYRLAFAQFGLLSSTMRTQDEALFDSYYDDVVDLLEKLIEGNKTWSEPHALLSATYGLKMGYSPMQGMFLGPKSGGLVDKAKKLNPKSALAYKVHANSKFFTPEMWGGDINEAIESYEKCIQLYEAEPVKYNWMYLDALAFLGQAYLKNGENGKAIATYEKALKVEPGFGWVKSSLLPKAKSKVNN